MEANQPTTEELFAVGQSQQAHRFFYKFALFCAMFGVYSLLSSQLHASVPLLIGCCLFGIASWSFIKHDLRLVSVVMVLCVITIIYHLVNFIHALNRVGDIPIIDLTVSPFTAIAALVPIVVLQKSMAFHRAGLSIKLTRAAELWIHDRANKARTLGPRYTPNSVHFQTIIDRRSNWYKPWKGWLERDVIVLVSGSSVWVLSPNELIFHEPQRYSLLGPKVTVQGRYYHGYQLDDYSLKNYTIWQESLSVHDDVWVPHA